MYTVVLGVESDAERAERAARAVADLPGDPAETRVVVLHSFQDNPSGASATQVAGVRAARDLLEDAGFEVVVGEDSGNPAQAILRRASEEDADMIVVGGRKRSPAGKALFGSTAQGVILDADRSVLVARDQEE